MGSLIYTLKVYLDLLVDLVNECLVEVERILLFTDVDALTPELENLPKLLRDIILKLTF